MREKFESWMKAVDTEVTRLSSLSARDLADQPFYDWYERGVTPKSAARKTLKAEGFPFSRRDS